MYSRTQNENGSYNSRCLDCFMTIVLSVETEEEIGQYEARHLCPEKVLSQMVEQKRSIAEAVELN